MTVEGYIQHGNFTDLFDYVAYVEYLGSLNARSEVKPLTPQLEENKGKEKIYTVSKENSNRIT